jgi:hypothetical protein
MTLRAAVPFVLRLSSRATSTPFPVERKLSLHIVNVCSPVRTFLGHYVVRHRTMATTM